MLDLLELLLVEDLVFETTLHDVFADFFDALDEEAFELVFVGDVGDLLKLQLLMLGLLIPQLSCEVSDGVGVVRFQGLHVPDDLFFYIFLLHL